MIPDHDSALWCARTKANYLLHRLPVEQIAYLGDTFPWLVTAEDLQLGAEHRQIAVGRFIVALSPAKWGSSSFRT